MVAFPNGTIASGAPVEANTIDQALIIRSIHDTLNNQSCGYTGNGRQNLNAVSNVIQAPGFLGRVASFAQGGCPALVRGRCSIWVRAREQPGGNERCLIDRWLSSHFPVLMSHSDVVPSVIIYNAYNGDVEPNTTS